MLNDFGAAIVVVTVLGSLICFWCHRTHESPKSRVDRRERDSRLRSGETRVLTFVRTVSRTAAQALFPIGCLVGESVPTTEEAIKDRDNWVDYYVYGWAAILLVAGGALAAYEYNRRASAGAATVLAWISAYRVIDIVISRADILTNFAGERPFSLSRARRSLVGSIVVLGQVIVAFAIMFDGWTSATSLTWSQPHLILGFGYISTRVLFTLGPAVDPVGWLAKLLVGAEVVSGFTVIGLGIAEYLGALRSSDA